MYPFLLFLLNTKRSSMAPNVASTIPNRFLFALLFAPFRAGTRYNGS